jgi:glutathione synthase/RimK-type ligase-like ATP-grasp enzyme
MRPRQIAIVSTNEDLHALIIQKALKKYDDLQCHIVESNRICGSAVLTWSNDVDSSSDCRVPVMESDDELNVRNLDVIWWRRVGYPQQIPSIITDTAQIDLIDNDCRAALVGLLLNEFRGTWINHPVNTMLAQNKLVQLRAAKNAGFRVPRTLVSQNPIAIRNFCEGLEYEVVVKSISGTQKAPLLTMMVTPEHLVCDESVALSPAIYQEYIPGEVHVRAQCFGDSVHSVTLKSKALDWRPDLNIPFKIIDLEEEVKTRLRDVLKLLGLKMGVVDLKFAEDGEPVWFEINPQGQFLFVEGLTGLDLTSAFTAFLYQEATRAPEVSK